VQLVALLTLLALSAAAPALAADPSLAQVPPGQVGVSRLLLDPGVPGPLATTDLAVLVGNGGARPTAVTPFATDAVYTAIAFDASGSFRPHLPAAIASAKAFASALPPGGRTAVYTFGSQLSDLGEGSGSAVSGLLDHAQDAKAEKVTRLKGLVSEVVDAVAHRQTGQALRQVVVFTDAGEESEVFSLNELVADARQAGVLVHVVNFVGVGGRQDATRLDEMKALAERTGGTHLEGGAADINSALADVARAPERLVWVDVAYCAVTATTPFVQDTVQVEIRRGEAPFPSTGKVEFNQQVAGPATAACAPQASGVTPVTDVTDVTDAPSPTSGTPPSTSGTLPWWAYALAGIGLLGLLALLGTIAVATRKKAPLSANGAGTASHDNTVRSEPAAPTRPPSVSPETTEDKVVPPPPPDPTDPFANLPPETQLTVVSAEGGLLEPYYRLTKRETVFGASGEADVVLDMSRISGRHAKFELFSNGAVWVTDLDSRNGTFVDGRRLAPNERVRLPPGALIGLSQQVGVRLRQPSRDPLHPPAPAPNLSQAPPSPSASAFAGSAPAAPTAAAGPARKVAKTIFQTAEGAPVPGTVSNTPGGPAVKEPPASTPSGSRPRKSARTVYSPIDED
jgi:hypothetical protein